MRSHAGLLLTSVSQATASLHSVQLSALLQGTSAVDVGHVLRTEKFWPSLDSSLLWWATCVVTSSSSGHRSFRTAAGALNDRGGRVESQLGCWACFHHVLPKKQTFTLSLCEEAESLKLCIYLLRFTEVYFSRCLFVETEEGYLKNYVVILLLFIHIIYGAHMKKIYVREIFKHPPRFSYLFCSRLGGQKVLWKFASFTLTVCRPGRNRRWGLIGPHERHLSRFTPAPESYCKFCCGRWRIGTARPKNMQKNKTTKKSSINKLVCQ